MNPDPSPDGEAEAEADPGAAPRPARSGSRPRLDGLDLKQLFTEGLRPDSDEAAPPGGDVPSIEGFEILRVIGRGGMGEVYLARQLSLDRLVAVKRIAGPAGLTTHFLDRLEREARTMAQVSHPNIVGVYDFLRLEDGGAAIVMEWVAGGNLREERMTRPGQPVATADTIAIVRDVLSSLSAAHEAGIIHRDIKPENILLTEKGTVKVTDFGLSLPEKEERITLTGAVVGTPGYMAPEQLEGGKVGPHTDIYAVGVLLYEMLTGRQPVGHFDPPWVLNPSLPRPLGKTVLACLKSNPAERFASASTLRDALGGAKAGSPSRRRVMAASLGGVAAVAAAGTGGFFLMRNRENEGEGAPENAATPPPPDPAGSGSPPSPTGAASREGTISGNWHVRDGTYESNGEIALYAIDPGRPIFNTDIRFSFTRKEGEFSVALFFRHPNGTVGCELSAWESDLGGIQTVNLQDLRQLPDAFNLPILNGRRYEIEIRIRPEHITTFVDGVEMQRQAIAGTELGVAQPWEWETRDVAGVDLALATYQSPTVFHSVEVSAGD